MEKNVIIISFDHGSIEAIREIDNEIPTGLLYYGNILNSPRMALDVMAQYLCPGWQAVPDYMIQDAHKESIKVNVWTIDDPEVMRRFIKMGVDAISTNKPDVLLKELGR